MATNKVDSVGEFANQVGLARYELDDLQLYESFTEAEIQELLMLLKSRLFKVIGSDPENLAHWMRSYNIVLKGVPLRLIHTPDGFRAVFKYLDSFSC